MLKHCVPAIVLLHMSLLPAGQELLSENHRDQAIWFGHTPKVSPFLLTSTLIVFMGS